VEKIVIATGDGSSTVAIPGMNVTYHSIHGAIQESMHVFVDAGLRHLARDRKAQPINLLEIGFGTGLNALLSLIESSTLNIEISYTAVELFPLPIDVTEQLNYCSLLRRPDLVDSFRLLHATGWDKETPMSPVFRFRKLNKDIKELLPMQERFDLVFFDAFAPDVQPELWTEEMFRGLVYSMSDKGVLVTYCSKGNVRRALLAAGFAVEKIPGPPGKREMMRGTREKR
jgi:tRNA U34 5-methylaminomethyl-2-thiouridine-forming methyltransferase MnmC